MIRIEYTVTVKLKVTTTTFANRDSIDSAVEDINVALADLLEREGYEVDITEDEVRPTITDIRY